MPTMRAAILTAPGQVEVQIVPRPLPAAGQVLMQVESCGVCPSNVPPFEGRPWFGYPFAPGALGHEGCGVIAALGPEVTGWQVGQRVGFLSYHSYAEFDVADATNLVALPESLAGQPFPAEPLGCAMNIFARAEVRPGQKATILGFGFLGALLTQLCLGAGAEVLVVARREDALAQARTLGALAVQGTREEVIEFTRQWTGDQWCPVVIEATGHQEPLDLAGELTAIRGRLVIAGYHQDGLRQVNLQLWNWRGLDVINAHERDPAIYLRGMQAAVAAVAAGRLHLAPLLTHTLPLEETGRALELTRTRPPGFMKALVQP